MSPLPPTPTPTPTPMANPAAPPKTSSGFGLLFALAATSGLAYIWPTTTLGWDPFLLPSTMLLGLVAATMFCLGMVVHMEELQELRERPACVLLGVAVQCTLMPGLAWLAIQLLGLSGDLAYGIVLVGCVPGAMASNVLTMTARGNVSYSVSLTTVATLLSPLTVPLALTVVGGITATPAAFQPGRTAWLLLLTVVLPVVLGFLFKRQFSLAQALARRAAPQIATLALLWIIASVVAANRERLAQIQSSMLLALAIINLLGYVGGWAAGLAARMPQSMRRALSLEVGMQNAGLGTALAASLFGGDSAAQIPTAAYTFGCMLSGTLLAWTWRRMATRTAALGLVPDG
ncbi:MAG: bile acid:sodium symporter family protein [Planctomycetales bacterium]|nr:bile acid:sodium symporter family protein [Planctomycetales bacterium]